ncbi:MAG: carbohydrate kinase family protein [Candidatus Gastranaerophilaceae bacterium]|jgi:sugar/nucleoside kinase (ribokinase family)
MFDMITIGSATRDIFIETNKAQILSLKDIEEKSELYCLKYGEKIEIDECSFEIGGGGVNMAVAYANLGLNTATLVKIGDGFNSNAVIKRIEEKNIDKTLIIRTSEFRTGFSVILTSFEGDRTVLAHRGANSHIREDEINWEFMKNTKWIHCAPLSGESNKLLDKIMNFAITNNIKTAYNPGGADLKRGLFDLEVVLKSVNVLVLNTSEASKLTGIVERTETKYDSGTQKPINICVKEMLYKLKEYVPEIVVITDGKYGIYAFDGDNFYYLPPFPTKLLSTLGAGDAFASTFTGCLIKCNGDIEKSIALASINASFVVQVYSAQRALRTYEELENIYKKETGYRTLKLKPEDA